MKNLTWAILFFMGSCGLVRKSNPSTYSFSQVQQVLNQQIVAWNSGSVDGFMQGYWHSDSLLFITSKGPRYGYDAVSNSYKKNYPTKEKMGNLTFNIVSMRWIDQPAGISEVLGKWSVVEASGNQASGYFSLIFKSVDGGPKIVIDHTW